MWDSFTVWGGPRRRVVAEGRVSPGKRLLFGDVDPERSRRGWIEGPGVRVQWCTTRGIERRLLFALVRAHGGALEANLASLRSEGVTTGGLRRRRWPVGFVSVM
jgi:hypothetical protein